MANAPSLPLRILYNLNRSPQYILARSVKRYPITMISPNQAGIFHYASTLPVQEIEVPVVEQPKFIYGSVSLKACLDTICCASPELMQDAKRDYSVYALDPLETQPMAGPVSVAADSTNPQAGSHPSTAVPMQQAQPVAVGLGLMSWALLADDESATVNGTVVRMGNGQEVLQVIFALRDAFPIQREALPDALRSWGLPPAPSKRSHHHASRSHHTSSSKTGNHPTKGINTGLSKGWSAPALTPQSSQSERILDSANVYVGPPKRKAGRPSSKPNETTSSVSSTKTSAPMAKLPATDSTSTTEPSIIAYLANLSPSDQNTALMSVLRSIDGQHTSEPNPALVDALKQLLSSHPPSSTGTTPPRTNSKPSSDDDIVVLDKENINPTVFKRREDKKPPAGAPDQTRASQPLGNMQNSPSSNSGVLRKRTLSEFMDERDRNRDHPPDENIGPRTGPTRPASSPVRSLRRHVPDWARTTTATQPRFSKETEEHMTKKSADAKQKKKDARKERRATGAGARLASRSSSDIRPPSPKDDITYPTVALHADRPLDAKQQAHRVAPVPASLPIFASDLTLPPSSPPPSSPTRLPPQTPIRRNIQRSPTAYGGTPEQSSLFTPTPKSWLSNPPNQSNSYGPHSSPLSSPRFLSGQGKKILRRSGGKLERLDGEGEPNEEVESPPSSLPIASSDVETDPSLDDQGLTEREPDFQHWTGLPPSSPPPPTSPILAPLEDCAREHEDTNDAMNPFIDIDHHTPTSDLGLSMSFDDFGGPASDFIDDFARISDGDMMAPPLSDDVAITTGSDDGFVEFDFTEFWQSVKPLMGLPDDGLGAGMSSSLWSPDDGKAGEMVDIDHSKLADEVRALFSGCLM